MITNKKFHILKAVKMSSVWPKLTSLGTAVSRPKTGRRCAAQIMGLTWMTGVAQEPYGDRCRIQRSTCRCWGRGRWKICRKNGQSHMSEFLLRPQTKNKNRRTRATFVFLIPGASESLTRQPRKGCSALGIWQPRSGKRRSSRHSR